MTTKASSSGETGRVRRSTGVTVTVPQPVLDAAVAPFALVGKVLPAKRGLPVYVGLGVLAAADAIAWPVAAGIGVAYASMRRWGQAKQPSRRSGEGSGEGRAT